MEFPAPAEIAPAVVMSVSVAGFDGRFSARDLAGFMESHVGGRVLRCRVKSSSCAPPPAASSSGPDFGVQAAAAHQPSSRSKRRRCSSIDDDDSCGAVRPAAAAPSYEDEEEATVVPPHAFVRLAHADPEAACRAAARRRLLLLVHGGAGMTGRGGGAARRRTAGTQSARFPGSRVEAGNLRTSHNLVVAWREPAVEFVLDPSDEACCRLLFSRNAAFRFPGTSPVNKVLRCDVKLEFPVVNIDEAVLLHDDDSLLLRLSAAPLLYYRTAAHDVYQSPCSSDLIDDDEEDDDPWIRTTDITGGTGAIGRCWVYKVSFGAAFRPKMLDALAYMKRRVPVVVSEGGRITVRDEWEFGQRVPVPFFLVEQQNNAATTALLLRFPTWFLVNALLHGGKVNQQQLTHEFFGLLLSSSRGGPPPEHGDDEVNVAALTEFLGEKHPVFDVCRKLRDLQNKAARNAKLILPPVVGSSGDNNDYNVKVYGMVITPTRAYCRPPQVERSNRVLRHYRHLSDRFLRVTFTDEGAAPLKSGALYARSAPILNELTPPKNALFKHKPTSTTVHGRVRRILATGFHLCGRKYSFLAFSSNQLRNRSAWFFADDGATTTTAESIREWMGRFPIRNVPKRAARMGQCFTSSYATVAMRPGEVDEFLPDVERNGYNFSDGIGRITPDLAMEVAERLPLTGGKVDDSAPPSAYQIRYAGFKGVVAVWPRQQQQDDDDDDDDGVRLALRPSMRKFESTHNVLEVVSWTKFQPGFLNRQIITLLTSLGVPEEVFWQMQEEMVRNLDRILSNSRTAFETVVSSLAAEHGHALRLMLSAGFSPATEPHLRAMLLAVRSAQLQGLHEKTKIFVPKSRWLMGCLDELGVLQQGQCFIRISSPLSSSSVHNGSSYSSRFFSWPPKSKDSVVVVGTVVMAKNPCLHPGDVRVLEAVDVPGLHHLVDCLVFPKNGDRPHPNEASGSDLDGDVYFVTWDEKLIPPGKRSWEPMDYFPAEAVQLQRDVRQHDIINFFLKNMTSDNIGRISNAHVVHADLSIAGAMDDRCLQLAELAATAVDSHKTGRNVTMPLHLRPTEYPDFMGKKEDVSYESRKILGRLYRSIRWYVHEIRSLEEEDSRDGGRCYYPYYDTDLVVDGASVFFTQAWQCKRSYEAQLNVLLNQYGVASEAELVTGEILGGSSSSSLDENGGDGRRRRRETEERLKCAYFELKQQFRSIFESTDDDADEEAGRHHRQLVSDECCKDLVYEMKASAWYQVTYHPVWVRKSREMEPNGETKLSFAWIVVDYLARIKRMRCR